VGPETSSAAASDHEFFCGGYFFGDPIKHSVAVGSSLSVPFKAKGEGLKGEG
jgi:hypothetical protein